MLLCGGPALLGAGNTVNGDQEDLSPPGSEIISKAERQMGAKEAREEATAVWYRMVKMVIPMEACGITEAQRGRAICPRSHS